MRQQPIYQDVQKLTNHIKRLEKKVLELAARVEARDEVEPLADYTEAAKFLGLSRSTLQEWVCYKKVPYYKVSRRVFFKLSELAPFRRGVKPVDPVAALKTLRP